ncbi:OsmC family protein [Ulvibacter antarcticus]|uniref:Putative OsmC-like protein n=1 Tax=Ulvibacter antarcticus TaxID=442714 RepID=A0A3L9YHS7_9FLAO|nr:OsmC family protein [Ulvibacter antarcticus]RMA58759.1 putative OsmC-like protein [Ulvibacter antarcticus]
MDFSITATSQSGKEGSFHLKNGAVSFGITKETAGLLSSPADIYLSSLAACILKNIERFSGMMKFQYDQATIKISATHFIKPPRLESIVYEVILLSKEEKINTALLKRNLEKFGTIYNMVAQSCNVSGNIIHK